MNDNDKKVLETILRTKGKPNLTKVAEHSELPFSTVSDTMKRIEAKYGTITYVIDPALEKKIRKDIKEVDVKSVVKKPTAKNINPKPRKESKTN